MMRVKICRWAAALSLAVLCACNTPQSSMNPAGPAGRSLAQIGWVTYLLFGIIAFAMWALLVWACVRKRGSLAEHEPWDTGGGQNWIFLGGLVFPLIVLSGMFVFAMERMSEFPIHPSTNITPEIRIVGHQWWWQVEYLQGGPSQEFQTANEIHIPTGRPVDVILETADVIHSFWIPALHGKVEMIPGQPNFIRLQADHPGNYDGECAEFCGEQHAHMRLLLVAQSPADYEAWRSAQLKPATVPSTPEAMHGQDVFNNTACALCHTVRGTVAQGKVAPDLTHLASRQYIAANSYRNDKADLEAWATHAQSLKPGVLMPDLPAYNGKDIRALVAYLQGLK
jgi:cytochrome c oxidase subunit 2